MEEDVYWYIGYRDTQRADPVDSSLRARTRDAGYDVLTTPITNGSFYSIVVDLIKTHRQAIDNAERSESLPLPLVPPLTPEYTSISPDDTLSSSIILISPWIDIGSPDPLVADISLQVLNLEIAYAAFCGLNNVLIPGPGSWPTRLATCNVNQYARGICQALDIGPYLQLHLAMDLEAPSDAVSLPLQHLSAYAEQSLSNLAVDDDDFDPLSVWEAWDCVRSMCKYSIRLSVALTVPVSPCPRSLLSRWFSEPVRILSLHSSVFVPNAKGFPALHKAHQSLLNYFATLKPPPMFLLSDVGEPTDGFGSTRNEHSLDTSTNDPTPAEAMNLSTPPPAAIDETAHLQYIRYLQRNQPPRPVVDRFAQGYHDYLQSPLQPLADNLESVTYEVFEKDPIKYAWYQEAVALALQDLYPTLNRPIIVAVAGAGRGPLVTRALAASESTGIPIIPYAVEKNQNAYVLLLRHNSTDPRWGGRVNVIKSDMRFWQGPLDPTTGQTTHVDILVSELLGSFADNELSPECLDGVQHVLHPGHGISIPQSYSAHVTPIATPRIYSDLSSRGGDEKWDLSYVVMLHQYDFLSQDEDPDDETVVADIQTAWSFSHPQSPTVLQQGQRRKGGSAVYGGSGGLSGGEGANDHNRRTATMVFLTEDRGVCHGLAGYFESVLYESKATGEKIELSINPNTMAAKSKDMISWFPIFFPLKTPLYVPDNAEMEVTMWRQTDDRKVWYEWLVEVFVHVNGKRQRSGMSELHSSWKNGCLM